MLWEQNAGFSKLWHRASPLPAPPQRAQTWNVSGKAAWPSGTPSPGKPHSIRSNSLNYNGILRGWTGGPVAPFATNTVLRAIFHLCSYGINAKASSESTWEPSSWCSVLHGKPFMGRTQCPHIHSTLLPGAKTLKHQPLSCGYPLQSLNLTPLPCPSSKNFCMLYLQCLPFEHHIQADGFLFLFLISVLIN